MPRNSSEFGSWHGASLNRALFESSFVIGHVVKVECLDVVDVELLDESRGLEVVRLCA